jgi:hypothetical protein
MNWELGHIISNLHEIDILVYISRTPAFLHIKKLSKTVSQLPKSFGLQCTQV